MMFRTTILLSGNNTGIEVPAEVVEALGGGKKPAVVVTIGSYSYRSSVAVMGGKFLIPLSAERRAESGIKGGDECRWTWRLIRSRARSPCRRI